MQDMIYISPGFLWTSFFWIDRFVKERKHFHKHIHIAYETLVIMNFLQHLYYNRNSSYHALSLKYGYCIRNTLLCINIISRIVALIPIRLWSDMSLCPVLHIVIWKSIYFLLTSQWFLFSLTCLLALYRNRLIFPAVFWKVTGLKFVIFKFAHDASIQKQFPQQETQN